MGHKLRLIISVLCGSIFGSTAFAAGPLGTIRVGAWSGGAFTDDKTGAFSHCSASTGYANGYLLVFGQNASGSWLIGFAKPKSNMTVGATVPVEVTFDGQAQFHLFGTFLTSDLLVAVLPNNAVVEQLRKAHLMVAVTQGGTSQFELKSEAAPVV
jgi:hypothetical protein